MIREMYASDWNEMTRIYRQSVDKGNVTFTTECPDYSEWDAAHINECRLRLTKQALDYIRNVVLE